MKYENSMEFAQASDRQDELSSLREQFLFPKLNDGESCVYLVGNSLGLQPKLAQKYIQQELEDWQRFGVEGHTQARHPWLPYHENVTAAMARVVGAKPKEVVVMNTLTVNLHLMMVSFYRPTSERYKILIEKNAFPSDQYAVASQARFHGYDPEVAVIATDDFFEALREHKDEIALVLIGDVNYLSGEAFDIAAITKQAHAAGAFVGVDLAHGAGNLLLELHSWGPDFAVWCSYKYLNSGPGALAGCFVHERHLGQKNIPRFEGWWGQNKQRRFLMEPTFDPIPTVEAWQLSNPPIFQLAAIRASLEIFDAATMPRLREKSVRLTGYLDYLLDQLPKGFCEVITPRESQRRGAQLSLRFKDHPRKIMEQLHRSGIMVDFREPNIIRAAPAPLYCRYQDVYQFALVLREHLKDL
jgi:kynureninase